MKRRKGISPGPGPPPFNAFFGTMDATHGYTGALPSPHWGQTPGHNFLWRYGETRVDVGHIEVPSCFFLSLCRERLGYPNPLLHRRIVCGRKCQSGPTVLFLPLSGVLFHESRMMVFIVRPKYLVLLINTIAYVFHNQDFSFLMSQSMQQSCRSINLIHIFAP